MAGMAAMGDPTMTKRMRFGGDESLDPHAPPRSKVVHARSVPDGLLSHEMTSALSKYGPISHVVLMPKIRQALVEFASIDSAQLCVNEAKDTGIMLRGHPVFFNFSKSQEINRGQGGHGAGVNRVLLMSIQNALFPITCDIINTICNKVGVQPLRIVMVRKRGIQALVEFDSVAAATNVKEQLNFQDIYKGCCTLKIEYSHTESLNVTFNSDDTKDYTNTSLPTRQVAAHTPQGMVGGYGAGGYAHGYGMPHQQGAGQHMPGAHSIQQADPYSQAAAGMGYGTQAQQHYGAQQQAMGGMGGQQAMGLPGSVMMFYELNTSKINCDALFNLVCPYANPIKIKFITSKPGMAMVQVDDPQAAASCLSFLKELVLFGQKIECAPSKHAFIAESRTQMALPDGTPSQVDYSQSRNHRFRTGTGLYQKNRLCAPSNVLHFFNSPKDTPHSSFIQLFVSRGAPPPIAIFTFPDDGKGKGTDRGLMEFASTEAAADALALCNHAELTVEDAEGRSRVFTTKYSFSNNHIEPDAVGVTRVGGHGGAVMAPPPGAVAAAGPPAAASGEPEPDFSSFDVE